MSVEETFPVELTSPTVPASGTRRGTLAALLAGSALGLAALSGASQAEAAKGKKGKKGKNKKGTKGSKGSSNVGGTLPSVRYVYQTTTFDNGGVGKASATCPDGYLPIGAGIWSSIPEPVILTSIPQLESNSWEFELDGVEPHLQATVTAICLAATDDTTVDDTEHRSTHHKRGKRGRKKSN